jgi:hypothetical protein
VSTPVSPGPTAFDLASVRVAQPVVSGGFLRWAQEASFVLGACVHHVGGGTIPQRGSGRTQLEGLAYSVPVAYTRSAGAQVLRIAVDLWPSNEIGDSQTVTVTLPTGATWLVSGGLDGTVTHYNPGQGRTATRELVGWADVSGVTVGDLTTWLSVATSPTSKGAGVRRVAVTEVPLASFPVDASDAGWDAAATRPGRPVIDGGAASPRGVERLWHLLDLGRADYRRHWQLCGVESASTAGYGTTPHWSRETASAGKVDWLAGSFDPAWYFQGRDLYGAATTPYKLRVRYKTSNATNCDLGVYIEDGNVVSDVWSATAAASRQTVTLAGTSGVWTWASANVTAPCGTLTRVKIDAKGPGHPELLSLSCVALIEDEG